MSQLVFTVLEIKEDIEVYGLRQKSNDKTQSKDIPSLLKKKFAFVCSESGGKRTVLLHISIGGL